MSTLIDIAIQGGLILSAEHVTVENGSEVFDFAFIQF